MISSHAKWCVSVLVELVRATHGTVTTRDTLLHNRVVCASINEWSMSVRGACDARCVTPRTRNIQQGQVWTLHFQSAFHFYQCQQSSESLDRRTRHRHHVMFLVNSVRLCATTLQRSLLSLKERTSASHFLSRRVGRTM